MKISKEQEEIIINSGVFGYDAEKLANILDIEPELIKEQFKDNNSEITKLRKKGVDKADYVLDLKLFEMAQSGDMKAMDKLNYRRKNRVK